jgi:hypothetical protein
MVVACQENHLRNALCQGITVNGYQIWTLIGFVEGPTTSGGQVKRNILRPMELTGRKEVDESTRNRKCTCPDGTQLEFV